jgi:hypothetical protein
MKFVARTFQTCFRRRWVASRCSRDLCRSATRRPEREKAMRQSRMVGTARRAVRRWFLAERSPRRGDPTLTRPPATDPLREKRFFDVFDGIETARSAMCDKNPLANPKGIASFSPGLARFREGLPWMEAIKFHNPERVEYQRLVKQIQPLQGCGFSLFSPRVARGPAFAALRRGKSQPWAESFNPVGIEKPIPPPRTSLGIPSMR